MAVGQVEFGGGGFQITHGGNPQQIAHRCGRDAQPCGFFLPQFHLQFGFLQRFVQLHVGNAADFLHLRFQGMCSLRQGFGVGTCQHDGHVALCEIVLEREADVGKLCQILPHFRFHFFLAQFTFFGGHQ